MSTWSPHASMLQAEVTRLKVENVELQERLNNWRAAALLREKEKAKLGAALQPFVTAYEKAACEMGDSDLYDEQPRSVHVTLGDCRRAARALT